ncbi:dynein intermediate chain 3, ciliary [Phthorimaea operculella]|nr:dynein intermediate chain 3, ciliary [Phthorimaea operculella]
MDITYQYMKMRCKFGRQPLFCEAGPDMCDSIPTNVAEHKNYILRNPVHELIQNSPAFSEHYINTIRAEYHNSGANHAEGGWAKDINIHDPEATQRYRRKIEKDDNYIHCVQVLAPGMEHYVLQNNAIDMYRSYYAEMVKMPPVEKNSVRTVNCYRDPYKRPVSSVSWFQETGHLFACSYVDVDFYRMPLNKVVGYVWEVENANSPQVILDPVHPMFDLQFSLRDINLLIGGISTGQVIHFDRRTGGKPEGSCMLHVAHRDIVRRVLFINSKSGMEFFSAGPDGMCKWWDLRNLKEPTDEMIIDVVKNANDQQSMANALAVSVLEYEPTIPTRFMVGTDNGFVVGGNRKGKSPLEKLPLKLEAHLGPVLSLQRNPSFPKNFLTVGDYTMKVWSEDCRESPIIWSPAMRHRINSGAWSPTRISLLTLCGADGQIALWDLLRRQHEPVLTMQVSQEALTTQSFQEKGTLNIVGNQVGNTFLIEFSPNLVESEKNDKTLLTSVFERESKRERILEARLREIRMKHRQQEEGSPVTSLTDVDPTVGDKDLAEASADYIAQVKKELAAF